MPPLCIPHPLSPLGILGPFPSHWDSLGLGMAGAGRGDTAGKLASAQKPLVMSLML